MIGSIDRPGLSKELGLPEHLMIQLVVALGYPAEKVVLEDGPPEPRPDWCDADGRHHNGGLVLAVAWGGPQWEATSLCCTGPTISGTI